MSELDPEFVEWLRMHRPRQPEGPATFVVRTLLMKNLWDKDPGVRESFREAKAMRCSVEGMERRMSDRFEATCTCPRCGLVATHHLRAPNPANDGSDFRIKRDDGEVTTIRLWGTVRLDERKYETIRTCNGCGHKWGQK